MKIPSIKLIVEKGFFKVAFFGVSFFLCLVLSGCSDQPSLSPDTQDREVALSKANASKYVPGTDITVQLRNDLSAGLDVALPAGKFYLSESIIVFDYSGGTVKGAGKDVTIIEAAQGYKGIPDPKLWDCIITVFFCVYNSKADVNFKDMTLQVKGDAPAVTHYNPFFGQATAIDNVIVVAGVYPEAEGSITATFENLRIKGEASNDPLSINGKNLAYPLIATGFTGNKPVNAVIKNCEIEMSGLVAIEYWDVFGGEGIIKDNEITNCLGGIFTGFWTDPLTVLGKVTIKNNRFTNMTTYAIRNVNTWSSYCFKNNTLDGALMTDDCQ